MLCVPNTSLDPEEVRKQPLICYEWPPTMSMINRVERYMPREPIVYHAVLWKGKAADLVEMPKFNELIEKINRIDSTGLLVLATDDIEVSVQPDREYIVHSSDLGFYVLPKKQFEESFEAIPTHAVKRNE